MSRNVEHHYHGGWDCVGSAERSPSGPFRAVLHCRSLVDGRIVAVEDPGLHGTEDEAVAQAMRTAARWTREHRHFTCGASPDRGPPAHAPFPET